MRSTTRRAPTHEPTPDRLADVELIAALLDEQPQSAQRILLSVDGISGLARAGELRLRRVVGDLGSRRLLAALELGRRALERPLDRGAPIRGAADVEERLRGRLVGLEQEELHVLGLDTLNRLAIHAVAAVGAVNRVYVSPQDVFRPLVRAAAVGAIVVHNHPSGSTEPSQADVELTARLVRAGAVLGVPVLDHVIIARGGRFSFAEHRQIPEAG